MISASDVLAVVRRLEAAGIAAWLDGGWGVDALLGAETRPHDDLDLVAVVTRAAAVAALGSLGFALTVDEWPVRFVLADPTDRRVDFHPITFDTDGGGLQQQPSGPPFRYPPEGFSGTGTIAGETVRCLTPDVQLLCHAGYEPDANDRHDVRLLCTRFGLPLPERYRVRSDPT